MAVPTRVTETCGDGCCSWSEWPSEYVCEGEECDAVVDRNSCWSDGVVDVEELKFNEDYTIIEFP